MAHSKSPPWAIVSQNDKDKRNRPIEGAPNPTFSALTRMKIEMKVKPNPPLIPSHIPNPNKHMLPRPRAPWQCNILPSLLLFQSTQSFGRFDFFVKTQKFCHCLLLFSLLSSVIIQFHLHPIFNVRFLLIN